MRPVNDLVSLAKVLDRRLDNLNLVADSIREQNNGACSVEITYVAIDALALWELFCRTYYVSCMVNDARRSGGTRVRHKTLVDLGENSAILESIRITRPSLYPKLNKVGGVAPHHEPVWHSKGVLLKLATGLSFSNEDCIANAFSYPTRFMYDLPPIRNFFAHRSKKSANAVRSLASSVYGVYDLVHPTDLINKTIEGKAQPLLIEWLIDMKEIGWQLCG